MFQTIETIDDVRPLVADKPEIRFAEQPNGTTVGCYVFCDSHTFDTPIALECRGIAFGHDGHIVSRPLHKFFNLGEREWLMPEAVLARDDVVAIFEKIDGSLIATAWVDGALQWRSRKSFSSDVVGLAGEIIAENPGIHDFASTVAAAGFTACFELTHPKARIVVDPGKPDLRLLHVRDNRTGAYVMLDSSHYIHGLIEQHAVPTVQRFDISLAEALASLEAMEGKEGYVVQFASGDMIKIKCPWYKRIHGSVTFLRERSIAELALNGELDDVKAALVEAGIDLAAVEAVERRVKERLLSIADEIEAVYATDGGLVRKDFAIKHKEHELFPLMMNRYLGRDLGVADWFLKRRLKEEFTLDTLASEALEESVG